MNTRQAIQPLTDPVVLNVAFSASRSRFIAGLSEGCRIFRADNCLPTYQPCLATNEGKNNDPATLVDGGVGVAAVLDDRYLAIVGGGKSPAGSQNVFAFWDATLGRQIAQFDLHERILGLRLSSRYTVAILAARTVVFEHQNLETQEPTPPASPPDDLSPSTGLRGPNRVKDLVSTAPNPYALACLGSKVLALPAQSVGQVQLVPLAGGSKRVFRAHTSAIRALALSEDGSVVATTSVQGTLVRVFSTDTLDQLAEFRRGVDQAAVHSLAISASNRWLACTSDKGTMHVFDLKPSSLPANTTREQSSKTQHRKSSSYANHRLSGGAFDKDSVSGMSGRSSPQSTAYQGSVQEYYGLRPPPMSASPTGQQAAVSALAAFKGSSLAPRVLKDVRSVSSAPFHTGNDSPHWQGGPSHSWTTTPTGTRKRVRNTVASLPNDPAGRPPKGIIAFAPTPTGKGKPHGLSNITDDDEGAVIYVVGGGSDPRWEMFELLPAESGGWILINRGYRKYLTRQFVD